jgi:hypothetical protein
MTQQHLKLAAAALQFGMARYAGGETRGTLTALVLKLFSGLCVGTATGFAVAALFIHLMPIIGAAGAALAVAGALLAVGAITAGVSQYLARSPSKQQLAERPRPDLEAVIADAENFVRDNKALALAAAFIAGMLVADETSKSRQN